MFWALKGATRYPLSLNIRQRAVTTRLFPTSEAEPNIARQGASVGGVFSDKEDKLQSLKQEDS